MASIAVDVLLSGIRDTSGSPLAAGLVYTYEPGTTTPRSLYTDSGLTTPAANPVVLDAYGMATVYADNTYKFVVKTSGGTTLYTWDNLNFQAPADDDFPNGGNAGGANRTMGNTDNYSLGFITNNANRVHITNAGDVGIGTTSPSFQLHVVDNSASLAGIRLEASQNNIATAIDVYGNGSNSNHRNWRIAANNVNGQLGFIKSTTSSGSPDTDVLVLTSAGNVGIGTPTGYPYIAPQMRLEIGDGSIFLNDLSESDHGIAFTQGAGTRFWVNAVSAGVFSIGGQGETPPSSGVININNSSLVGIGTSTPSAKLAINGGLHVGGDSDPGDNNCTVDGEMLAATIATNASYSWTLSGYTTTAPAATGYVTVTIEGVTYKLLAST